MPSGFFALLDDVAGIAKLAAASHPDTLLILLPAAVLLNAVAPWAVTPLLMLGGLFLCFEGVEKLVEVMSGPGAHTAVEAVDPDPRRLEEGRVRGAIRTDLVLSGEIMAI